jgi:ketosteroid isomerase-like protein
MTHDDVNRWLAAYIGAWRTYDPDAIADLFAEDATYRHRAWDSPIEGRAAITADWLDNPDDPGAWRAEYEAWVVEGDRAVATGTSRYDDADGLATYHNVFQLEFDSDGRCRAYTELYVLER